MDSDLLIKYYDSFKKKSDLEKLIDEKASESLYLEFKEKTDPSNGLLGRDDKKNFSKALSSFANSAGGVLIFGIVDEHSIASGLKPIQGIKTFQKRLLGSIIQATQPVVDDVGIDIVYDSKTKDAGYIKCFIPKSDKTPHRAMLAHREYYKRTAEGSYRMEHYDLEDMFGRRPRPSLNMVITSENVKDKAKKERYKKITFGFINEGRAIARYYGFFSKFNDNIEIKTMEGGVRNRTVLNKGIPTLSYENNVGVIHPNSVNHILGSVTINKKSTKIRKNILEGSYYCENMLPKDFKFRL